MTSVDNNCDKVTNKLSCILVNIRSLRKNLSDLVCTLEQTHNKPDIIVLTETWIFTHEEGQYNITGYNSYFTSTYTNAAGGVAIYIKNTLTSYKVAGYDRNMQACIVNILMGNKKSIQLTGAYRSPTSSVSNIEEFLKEDLPTVLASGSTEQADSIWLADANIDLSRLNNNAEDYLNLLAESGYIWAETGTTRENDNGIDSIIDHIFIRSINVQFDNCEVADTNGISDHSMLSINLFIDCPGDQVLEGGSGVTYTNWKIFDNLFSREDFRQIYEQTDPDKVMEILTKKIEVCRFKSQFTARESRDCQPMKPWITSGILNSIKIRNRLRQLVKRYPHLPVLKERFTRYRNQLRKIIRDAEDLHLRTAIQGTDNPKDAWRVINNEIRGKKQPKAACFYSNVRRH